LVNTLYLETRVDLVGLGAEIFGHHDQCGNDALIVDGRRYPEAEGGLATQIRRTRHMELPLERHDNSRVSIQFRAKRKKARTMAAARELTAVS
jgi:hypothetical protein